MVQLLVTAMLAVSTIAAAPNRAQWQSDYGKALAATRADDRPLLVVLDVPNDPEAAVASEQLEAKGEQSELLGAYQRCHIDVSTEYGKKVAEVFEADEFPFTAIIDKTGSVVLCKKLGQLSSEEWQATLAAYQKGERQSPTLHTSFYRGDDVVYQSNSTTPNIVSPSYCPSCQLRAQ